MRAPSSARGSGTGTYFERFTLNQRIQHITLMLSFSLLVLTGFPVRYPDSAVSGFIINVLGGYTARGVLHRVCAVILIGLAVYHVFYTMLARRGRSELHALLPRRKDFADLFHMLKYCFTFAPTGPRFDRYNYVEKFEYFAVGWGSALMILTGFVLWFAEQALRILPMWAVDIARVAHSYEALLAFLTILIWHFYHAHLKPGRFPMDRSWLTGKVSEAEMMHNHPLEHERLMAERGGGVTARRESREIEEEQ